MIRVWCDVGGTFTDTLVEESKPATGNERKRLKVLSSGITQASIKRWIDPRTLELDLPPHADDFWAATKLRFRDLNGNIQVATGIASSRLNLVQLHEAIAPAQQSVLVQSDIDASREAPVLAIHRLLNIPLNQTLPSELDVRLGTTRGTNALLTRSGAKTALLITAPFDDLLLIGHQDRPELFTLDIRKRKPLYDQVVPVYERILADGSIEKPLDRNAARQSLVKLNDAGIQSIAISLFNAYINPQHELELAKIAREVGFNDISVGSQLSAISKWVDRTETTVVDAYLGPIVGEYLRRIHQQLGGSPQQRLRVMTSAGGLVDFRSYRGRDSVLSGPAGGVVAIDKLAQSLGSTACSRRKLIGLDMGGTSTDVCRIDVEPELIYESVKAEVRMLAPTLDIHTVASGGGSVCSFDGVQWHVGPQSAGANPGPACYQRGGPLTVTDLNLLTGRLTADALPLDVSESTAHDALQRLAHAAHQPTDRESLIRLAQSLRNLANEQMAAAVRSITIARGAEPAEHALVGFGGAAGQHLCEVAEILGISTLIDLPDAGVLSAVGMGLAAIQRSSSVAVYQPLDQVTLDTLKQQFAILEAKLLEELKQEGIAEADVRFQRSVDVRTSGTDRTLTVSYAALPDIVQEYHTLHAKRFGFQRLDLPLELAILRVKASVASNVEWRRPTTADFERLDAIRESAIQPSPSPRSGQIYSRGNWHICPYYERSELLPGQTLAGPCVIFSSSHTTVVEHGWVGFVTEDFSILIAKRHVLPVVERRELSDTNITYREVFAQRIAAIANEMGIVLEQTSISVNIRDRRDFSCAVFDSQGQLLANAPHVPVHLGAMQTTVQYAIRMFPDMQPGDCLITNDPFCGGSHLPDITLISPVFFLGQDTPIFYVANRAHHAEIGGTVPGSMSPNATCLSEEGVLIPMAYFAKGGTDFSEQFFHLLTQGPYPSRSPSQNIADLHAQAAANQRGASALQELAKEFDLSQLPQLIEEVLQLTETKVRSWIASQKCRQVTFQDQLDDGTKINVGLHFQGETLQVDFAGTGPMSSRNLNASPGIVNAAILYVVRCMLNDDLPMNYGAMRPIEVTIPTSILNPPTSGDIATRPAVGAGNVETSQRVVDVLLGALGICGASQGTMNNLLMGNHEFGFYETLAGGSGATANVVGADAVHTHMTNTRLTDPEIIERRYPLRLRQLSIRRDSGGAGRNKGGNGMIREFEFLQELTVSLITSRRSPHQPYGMNGGQPALSGVNFLVNADGSVETLPSSVQLLVMPGQRIRIETPGGGGFGKLD